MLKQNKANYFFVLIAYTLFFSTHAIAKIPSSDEAKIQSSLLQVQNEMKQLEKTLYHNKHQERELLRQLANTEVEIGEQSEKVIRIERKIHEHQVTLQSLKQKQAALQISHQSQLKALSDLVNSTYKHQKKERLQLLFEPNEWSTLARLNEYYYRFYHARANHLADLRNDLIQLQLIQEPILREQQAQYALTDKLKKQHVALEEKRLHRQKLLASLSSERLTTEEKLYQLQQQEEHLATLFKSLANKLHITPAYIEPIQNFSTMKRKLLLPIQTQGATLSMIPHAKKENAKKTYIEAIAGTPVNAIFPGKVVFAEWLRGVGLLIILDHGNGYMSLYGNNQKLYKTLGDSVNQGEMIARVGESGGHAKAGLYFEIRKDGEALDPTPWFQQT